MPDLHNLLVDSVFGVRLGDERKFLCLPEVFESLCHHDDVEFTALQVHQQHGWHAFLVQVAALALHADGTAEVQGSSEEWRTRLRTLTEDRDEAWTLVVEKLAQPAFMQPPVPEGTLDALKATHASPSEIDTLVTAKNHEIKQVRLRAPRPEHWAYALVTLQTMEGFLGAGNYGIARMNGGFASRPSVSYAPDFAAPARFRRDVRALVAGREELVNEYGYQDQGGTALLWTVPWDGKQTIALSACDPFFIEVCRRVRMISRQSDGQLVLHRGSSKVARLDSKDLLGNTGDPWTPVNRATGKALTATGAGFDYVLTRDLLLTDDYRGGIAGRADSDDGAAPIFAASVLARGQGKTDGFHKRFVPVPRKVQAMFGRKGGKDRLAELSASRIERARAARLKVLKPALCALVQGGPDEIDFRDDRTDHLLREFDRQIDEVFFEALWRDAELSDEEAEARWQKDLHGRAEQLFERAITSLPIPSGRRERAIARGELALKRSSYKNLPAVFSAREESNGTSANT